MEGRSAGPIGIRAGWFDCRVDDDCRMIRDPLCRILSVNREHVADVVMWVAEEEPPRSSGPPCDIELAPRDIDYYPRCDTGKCSSMPSVDPFQAEDASR